MDRDSENLVPGNVPSLPGDCPDPLGWYQIAAGGLPEETVQHYMQHATDCAKCGCLLRDAVSDFNEETSAEETRQITGLESAQPDWQYRLAVRIAGTVTPEAKPESVRWKWWTTPRLIATLAGTLAVAVAGYVYEFRVSREQQVSQLLAQAGSLRRITELRMEGSKYASLGEGLKREAASTFLSSPGELLKAESLIYEQLAAHPSDPFWLHAKARADLLDGKYDAAQATLIRAWQLDPKSPEILTDLATAYFQQNNYAAAYERLSEALGMKPDDPVALFNRAIVGEQLHFYRQALDDTERYLKIEPHSGWATEAGARADRLRSKLEKHDQGQAAPLLSPPQLVASVSDPNIGLVVDQRIDEYLNEAAVTWLPEAYPQRAGTADPAARQALFFLADLTRQRHNDLWLSDLLRDSSSPNFPAAVAALARAARANKAGEHDAAATNGASAARLFRAAGNVAGLLLAGFEQAFAAHVNRQGETCRGEATAAFAESQKYSYPWLQIQLGLEKGACSFLMGDIGGDEAVTAHATDLARNSDYGALVLRAVFFAADDKLSTGDRDGAISLVGSGLQSFWSGQFPAERGFNLYSEWADIAQSGAWPNLQMASCREATGLVDSGGDFLLRAWAHYCSADAATAARQPEIAERQYSEAARLFALAPPTEANRTYAIETGIRNARLESRFGRFDAAIELLTSIQDQIRPLSNNLLTQMFYSTLGELQVRRNLDPQAEQALRPALALAEQSLMTLRSESQRTSWSKDAAPSYLALVEAELAQGRTQNALEVYEWFLAAPQRESGASAVRPLTNPAMPEPPTLAGRLPLLTKETVLAYAALPDGLAIWVYDDRGVKVSWTPKPTEDIQELAAKFQELTSDPRSEPSALHRDARSLYAALIAPVEQHLAPGRTLVIEAGGWLARVPFEALLDADNHYLIERAPIVHSFGQDSQARLRVDDGISSGMSALVVGSTASSPADGLIALPDVAAEADSVSLEFHSASVLKSGQATLNAVRRELPGAAVFHFAGHSLATPEKAGLLLAGESQSDPLLLLDGDTLQRVKLPAMRLAVLSACSTAAGSGGSNGFKSITEALIRTGVPHVVASRWAVDSVEARAFVEDFYKNALSGESVSGAIRLTSRKMLASPRTAHPYYWSAFAAYGRP
ncbi:MAG TPA: CHAT domain-containing protein [Terriglobales bacterium]|nr:CHAT domain-containing protein [Terriglobales bacterium]